MGRPLLWRSNGACMYYTPAAQLRVTDGSCIRRALMRTRSFTRELRGEVSSRWRKEDGYWGAPAKPHGPLCIAGTLTKAGGKANPTREQTPGRRARIVAAEAAPARRSRAAR